MIFDFTREPRGRTYDWLIRSMSERGSSFGFAVRNREQLSQRGRGLVEDLDEELTSSRLSSRWPGTVWSRQAVVNTYRLDARACSIILAATDGLFDWEEPDLPSDLFILDGSDRPIITSVSKRPS